MGKKKYFIAIILREESLAQAEGIKEELFRLFGLKGALRSPAHITLHRPFEWKEEKEEQLREKLRSFSGQTPFPIKLNGWDSFSNRVIFVAIEPNNSLSKLYASLTGFARRELNLLNEWEDERGFHPHVTVAFRDLKTKNFTQVWEFVQSREFYHEMLVSGISLLKLEDKWEELEYIGFV
jgi:2'-5' RNA ligase